MGFLEGLFHPQGEVADMAQAQNNADSNIEAAPSPDIADTKEQDGASKASIAPTHMDMAGSGPATVDLSGVKVSPVESTDAGAIDQAAISAIEANIDASNKIVSSSPDAGESVDEGSEIADESTDGSASESTDESADGSTSESVEPVLPGEFSTAVAVDTGIESPPVTEPHQTDPDEEQPVGVSTAGAGAALDQLAQWQVSDAVGDSEANLGERTDNQPDTSSVTEHDELSKSTSSTAEAITAPLEDVPQTNKKPDKSEGAEDFAKKLNAAASLEADEMDARKAAMEAGNNDSLTPVAATLDATPEESQSDMEGSTIKNSDKDDGTEELTDAHTTDEVAAEAIKPDRFENTPTDKLPADDTSFPELKVESDASLSSVESPIVESPIEESEPVKVNSASEIVEPPTVGGADVHTDRTEYVTSEEKPDLVGDDVEKSHPERLVISLEDRRTLEAAEKVIKDLLDKAA